MGRKRKHPKRKIKAKWFQKEDDWGNIKFDWALGLEGSTWREIFGFLTLVMSVVILLGFFDSAGIVGEGVIEITRRFFGLIGAYSFTAIYFYVGYILLIPPKHGYNLSRFIGLFLAMIAVPAFFHLFVPIEESAEVAALGEGGGLIGMLFADILRASIGLFPAFLFIVVLTFIAIIIIFNLSVSKYLGVNNDNDDDEENRGKVTINNGDEAKVSVFNTVRRKLSSLRKKKDGAAAPVVEVAPPMMSASRKDAVAWEYPSIEILKDSDEVASSGNINKNAEIIQKTMENFGIKVAMSEVNVGPTVTQYTLKPDQGVKLNQIVARQTDMALALSAKSLRVEAPIPGKNAVGIEIPNKVPAKVTLREVVVSNQMKAVKSKLALALGRDVSGDPVAVDLEKMPHVLIAGATGSGKSVCINSIIVALLFNNAPEDLRLLLVDPKRVELTGYNGVSHLLTPVVTEVDKTVSALKWAVHEMERRYEMFSRSGKRNIAAYNASPGQEGKLPYIVVIIDELADLMATSAKEVEGSIVRLAQMARATGIHLIIATQRPSVDVLTGLIKANIPVRIAFATASQVDSRTILDISGAEKLLGNGDMLFMGNGIEKPRRIQGCFVSDNEIEELNNYLREKRTAEYDESILSYRPAKSTGAASGDGAAEDELYDEAVEVVMSAGKASASLLQRRLRVGYARAARLLDILEEAGVIGPAEGAKPRDVLVSDAGSDNFGGGFEDGGYDADNSEYKRS